MKKSKFFGWTVMSLAAVFLFGRMSVAQEPVPEVPDPLAPASADAPPVAPAPPVSPAEEPPAPPLPLEDPATDPAPPLEPPSPPVTPPEAPSPPPVEPSPPADPPVPPVDPPADPVVPDPENPNEKEPGEEAESKEEKPRVITKERRIYIPFEELEDAFADEGRGVFLPYREFLELWSELSMERKEKEKAKPPTDAILSSANYTARLVGEDTFEIEAELATESFKDDGWAILKLGSPGMNIAEADTGASILRLAPDGSYEILIPEKGKYKATLKIFAKITHGGGRHYSRIHLPKSAVSKFTGVIDGRDWEFEINPGAPFTTRDAGESGTELSFFFGGGEPIEVSWQKRGGETKLTPLLFAQTNLDCKVQAGALSSVVAMNYRVLRAGVDEFEIAIPSPHEVLGVSGENIREWDIAKDGENQVLKVNLHVPAKDHYSLEVTLEAPIENLPASLSVPTPEAVDAVRQRGTVSFSASQDLEVLLQDLEGLTQQGAGFDPASNAANPAPVPIESAQDLGTYRFLKFPFQAGLSVKRAEPVVEVNSFTRAAVEPDVSEFSARFNYSIKRVGIFNTRIRIPGGYDNVEASGGPVEDFTVIELPDAGGTALDVKFSGRQFGEVAFRITGQKPRATEDEDFEVPVFSPLGVSRHEGKVGLDIHTSLEPNTKALGGMRQEDVSRLGELIGGSAKSNLTPLALGFHYRNETEPAAIAFKLKQSQVTAEVQTLVEVKEQLARYSWNLNFSVLYAGIDSFVVAVPTEHSDSIRLEDQSVKEIQKDYQPEEGADPVPDGMTLWKVILRDKKLGNFNLDLSLEVPLDGLEPGKEVEINLPQIFLRGIFQESGTVAVIKDGSLEILKPKATNLEAIDPKELPSGLMRDGVFLAYKYKRQPIALALAVSKNEFLNVPQALVNHAVLRSVVASDGGITTEVVYWMTNNTMQFLSLKLPKVGESEGRIISDVYVGGTPEQPMKRPDSEEIAIRLPSGQEGSKFTVRFVYQIPSEDAGSEMGMWGTVTVPAPELLNAEVLRSTVGLYLPSENVYTGFDGPMKRPVTSRGWNRFRGTFDWMIPALGPEPDTVPISGWTPAPRLPAGVAAGFDVPVKGEGTAFNLYRLAAPAAIAISYRSRGFSFMIEALFCLAALLGGLAICNAPVGMKTAYFVVVGLGSLLIAGAVNPGGARVWSAAFLGALLAVFGWIIIGMYRKTRQAMTEAEATAATRGGGATAASAQPTESRSSRSESEKGDGDDKGEGSGAGGDPDDDGGDGSPSGSGSGQQIITDPFSERDIPPKARKKEKKKSKGKDPDPPSFPEVGPKKDD